MGQVNKENLNEVMTYHAPTPTQQAAYEKIKEAAIVLSNVILEVCPACADRSDALRLVRNARMTANASVALNGLI